MPQSVLPTLVQQTKDVPEGASPTSKRAKDGVLAFGVRFEFPEASPSRGDMALRILEPEGSVFQFRKRSPRRAVSGGTAVVEPGCSRISACPHRGPALQYGCSVCSTAVRVVCAAAYRMCYASVFLKYFCVDFNRVGR